MKPLAVLSAAALGGALLVLAYRRRDGSTGEVGELAEVTVSVQRQTAPAKDGPLALRNNNPGNLRSWPGVSSEGGYAKFETPLAGMRAAFINLHTYFSRHGLKTVRAIINRWAPHSENPTDSYVAFVAKRLSVSPDQELSYSTHATGLIRAIARFEAGADVWPDSLFAEGRAAAGKG